MSKHKNIEEFLTTFVINDKCKVTKPEIWSTAKILFSEISAIKDKKVDPATNSAQSNQNDDDDDSNEGDDDSQFIKLIMSIKFLHFPKFMTSDQILQCIHKNDLMTRMLAAYDADVNATIPKPKKVVSHGFMKPVQITDQLADFLKNVAGFTQVSRGDIMTRVEATKLLNKYIVAQNLQDPFDRRRILYQKDKEFEKLIHLPYQGSDLGYFNLQSAIRHLFVKV